MQKAALYPVVATGLCDDRQADFLSLGERGGGHIAGVHSWLPSFGMPLASGKMKTRVDAWVLAESKQEALDKGRALFDPFLSEISVEAEGEPQPLKVYRSHVILTVSTLSLSKEDAEMRVAQEIEGSLNFPGDAAEDGLPMAAEIDSQYTEAGQESEAQGAAEPAAIQP